MRAGLLCRLWRGLVRYSWLHVLDGTDILISTLVEQMRQNVQAQITEGFFIGVLDRTGSHRSASEIDHGLVLRRNDEQQASAGMEKAFNSGQLCDTHGRWHRSRGSAKQDPVESTTEESAICGL